MRIVFVEEPANEGSGFPVVQVTAADGSEQSSVILDCRQQLVAVTEATALTDDVSYHDSDAQLACARLPRSCPEHRLS